MADALAPVRCRHPLPVAIGAALAALVVCAPALRFPLGLDQAVFAYLGRVIAAGGVPYRDAWDVKPPGIHLVYALAAALFTDPGWYVGALRALDCAVAAATALVLGLLARRWLEPGPARTLAVVAAAIWYASLYLAQGYMAMAQPEALANLPAALAVYRCQRRSSDLGVGLLLGAVTLLKPTSLAAVAPVVVLLLAQRPAAWTAARPVLVGWALPLLAVGAWLAAIGGLAAYLEIVRSFGPGYLQMGGGAGPAVLRWGARFAIPVAAALLAATGPGRRPLLAWLVAALLVVLAQGKGYLYHFDVVVPAVAVGAALGTARLAAGARWRPLLLLGCPVLWAGWANRATYVAFAALVSGALPLARWSARFHEVSPPVQQRLGQTVAALTTPGQPILVWGLDPAVYILSGRSSSTRFFYHVPLVVPFAPARWREEFLHDLRIAAPALIVTFTDDRIGAATGWQADAAELLRRWSDLRSFVEANYRFQTQLGNAVVYTRREEDRPWR
jgi:hypothetical protein